MKFSEFFVTPVGRYGFELTDRIKALNGKRVRIYGFMVKRDEPGKGRFLLAPMPVSLEEHEAGAADLPPNALLVTLPYAKNQLITFTDRPLLLTGVLTVGPQEENGFTAYFRLTLDEPPHPKAGKSKPNAIKPVAPAARP